MTTTCTTIEPKPRDDHNIPDDALNQILHELLHTSFSTDKILAERNLKVSTFASWITSERALNLFRSLKEISLLRAQILAADRTLRAIIALGTIVSADVESPRHAETIRKAATTLIKLTDRLNTITTPSTTDNHDLLPTNPQRKQGSTASSLPPSDSFPTSASSSSPSPLPHLGAGPFQAPTTCSSSLDSTGCPAPCCPEHGAGYQPSSHHTPNVPPTHRSNQVGALHNNTTYPTTHTCVNQPP